MKEFEVTVKVEIDNINQEIRLKPKNQEDNEKLNQGFGPFESCSRKRCQTNISKIFKKFWFFRKPDGTIVIANSDSKEKKLESK
jgi:hypothetical protein